MKCRDIECLESSKRQKTSCNQMHEHVFPAYYPDPVVEDSKENNIICAKKLKRYLIFVFKIIFLNHIVYLMSQEKFREGGGGPIFLQISWHLFLPVLIPLFIYFFKNMGKKWQNKKYLWADFVQVSPRPIQGAKTFLKWSVRRWKNVSKLIFLSSLIKYRYI